MRPHEAVDLMDRHIDSIPDSAIHEDIEFLVSKDVYCALAEYTKLLIGEKNFPGKEEVESGYKFTWKGYNCKVA